MNLRDSCYEKPKDKTAFRVGTIFEGGLGKKSIKEINENENCIYYNPEGCDLLSNFKKNIKSNKYIILEY